MSFDAKKVVSRDSRGPWCDSSGDSPALRQLEERVAQAGLPFGREDSFKLTPGAVLGGRAMLGVRAEHALLAKVLDIGARLGAEEGAAPPGLPANVAALLHQHHARADTVLFGIEPGPQQTVFKIYLEFWDEVARHVRATGSRQPRLLDLGLKWTPGDAQARVARYMCYPLLAARECVDRVRALHGPGWQACTACELASGLVDQSARRKPEASFIYMEVEEEGTPRRSFDLNLYKAGWRMAELGPWLEQVRAHFQPPADAWSRLMGQVGEQVLGHISGGVDRRGDDFLTIYYEIAPL